VHYVKGMSQIFIELHFENTIPLRLGKIKFM